MPGIADDPGAGVDDPPTLPPAPPPIAGEEGIALDDIIACGDIIAEGDAIDFMLAFFIFFFIFLDILPEAIGFGEDIMLPDAIGIGEAASAAPDNVAMKATKANKRFICLQTPKVKS